MSPHSGKGLPLSREAFPARGRPPLDKVTRVTDRNMERRSGGSESGRQDPFQAIMHTIAARCRCKGGPFGLEVEQIGADGVPSLDAASPPWVGRWDFWTWRAERPCGPNHWQACKRACAFDQPLSALGLPRGEELAPP